MKTKISFLLLIVSALICKGCAQISSDDPIIEQINSVRTLSFESNRKNAYLRIAQNPDLTDKAQVHLIKSVFDTLEFDSSKEMVLLTLIENPSFCEDAETAILKRLNRISFEKTKDNILKAIDAAHTWRNMNNTEQGTAN